MSENSLEFELIKGQNSLLCSKQIEVKDNTMQYLSKYTWLYSLNDRIPKKKLNQDVESNTDLVRSIASISGYKYLSGSEPK